MKGWITIHKLDSKIKAKLIEDKLSQYDIPSVCINKIDSSYNNFGTVHIQVPVEYVDNANQIIENLNRL